MPSRLRAEPRCCREQVGRRRWGGRKEGERFEHVFTPGFTLGAARRQLSVVTGPKAQPMLKDNEHINKVIIFDKRQPPLKTFQWILNLRKENFSNEYFFDGLHFNEAGSKKIAELIGAEILQHEKD